MEGIWLLCVIPVLGIIIIILNQFWDEMFKKKFVIERRSGARTGSAADRRTPGGPEARPRRYNDPSPETTPNASADKTAQAFESPMVRTPQTSD